MPGGARSSACFVRCPKNRSFRGPSPDLVICDHRGFFDALVHARSGDSGALLWQIALPGLEGAPFISMAPIADQNEDGIEDVLVGVYDSEAHGPLMEGRLHALSGTTGQVIWQIDEWDVKR